MIKGKILKITENTVYIGYEDGSLKEIPIESCEFEPRMGDYVEVYGDIAIKVEGSNESTPVKKSEAKKISLVSKINIFSSIVLFPISFSLLHDRGLILEVTIVSLCVISLLLIVLNLILLIISSIKKNKVNKKSSITYLIIAIIIFILSTVYVSNYVVRPHSKKTVSQSTSKPSTSSSKNSSNSSSQESSSSSTKSSISGNIPKNLLTIDYEERTDKQKYSSSFDYDKWIHDEFPRYLKLHVRGEVVQILKDQDDKGILVQIVLNEIGRPGLGEPVSVFIPGDYLSDIIVEGDKLDLYGKTYGVKQYSSGDSVVMRPFMIAYFYERDK